VAWFVPGWTKLALPVNSATKMAAGGIPFMPEE
jgi:hypothetical protein